MAYKESKKKAHIMKTVLKMISEGDENRFTTREIARKAKVNQAAINYYFGSKDNLIKEAEKYYILQATKVTIDAAEGGRSVEDNLLNICLEYSGYVTANLDLQRNIWGHIIAESQTRPEVEEVIQDNFALFKNVIKEIFKKKTDKELSFLSIILCSALFYPVLLSNYESKVNIGLKTTPESVKEYCKALVNFILSIH